MLDQLVLCSQPQQRNVKCYQTDHLMMKINNNKISKSNLINYFNGINLRKFREFQPFLRN